MIALVFEEFGGLPSVQRVADPAPADGGAVIAVRATGICRSDWHAWQGHDADIRQLPHVPGHEFVGEIVAVGSAVQTRRIGERVTMPFVAGCGACVECLSGAPQVCPQQFQPGFSGWGSFAELVAVRYADFNLVPVPPEIDDVTAATFGCRLATAYRAVALVGRAEPGHWVAVHGCGGAGLSAVMIAAALGARPIAVDVSDQALQLASQLGAEHMLHVRCVADVPDAIRAITGRGADLSLDALGSGETAANSLRCLRPRGRHVQLGLLLGAEARPRLPMELVIARELKLCGVHGLAAADYPPLLALAARGRIRPQALVQRTISLDEAPTALSAMGEFRGPGVTVINRF